MDEEKFEKDCLHNIGKHTIANTKNTIRVP